MIENIEFRLTPVTDWVESASSGPLYLETTDLGLDGPAGEPALRLESLNQLVDGDFPAGLPAFWDSTPIATPMTVDNILPASGIRFTRTSPEQFISVDLFDVNNLATSDVPLGQRQFRVNIRFQMDFALPDERFFGLVQKELDLTNVLYVEDTPSLSARNFPMNQAQLVSVTGIAPQTSFERILIGGELSRETTIYSVRVLEDDSSKYYIETVLPKVPSIDSLPFPEQGRFEFSFSARRHNALAANRFHADFVSVEMIPYSVNKPESGFIDVSSATDSSWTRYTVSVPNPLGTELREMNDDDQALIIRIYPFSSGVVDAGTIELSNPELYFFPE
ncbi:MAG: hypothetical protein GW949_08850 [Spirochaetales bacterium]|nr:hypothetical protein [Spirochaetales bacterium]